MGVVDFKGACQAHHARLLGIEASQWAHVGRQARVHPGFGASPGADLPATRASLPGDRYIKRFTCQDEFRCMAFAQLAHRASLRDIETCLRAQERKLYHMGIPVWVSRSTLAQANETRDSRLYADFAQRLTHKARKLYVDEDLGLEPANTIYALNATTIDLSLSLFPWAPFQPTRAAVNRPP